MFTFFNKQFANLTVNTRYDRGIGIGSDRRGSLVGGIDIRSERLCDFDGNRCLGEDSLFTGRGSFDDFAARKQGASDE